MCARHSNRNWNFDKEKLIFFASDNIMKINLEVHCRAAQKLCNGSTEGVEAVES